MKVIIVAPVGKVERTDLEMIENQKFNSTQAILNEFPNDTIQIFTLSEFMDACNNSDDDTPIGLSIDIANSWIGYVELVGDGSGLTGVTVTPPPQTKHRKL